MNRIGNKIMLLLFLTVMSACKETPLPPADGDNGDTPAQGLPVPPEEVNNSNIFCIDFFSTLEDDGNFFEKRDVGVAAQYIQGQTGIRPVMYMYDRADFTVGESYPLNKMSYDIGIYQFFVQNQKTTDSVIEGTGIATLYHISKFDGIAQNGAYMSGCTLPVPIKTPTNICIYTSRIETLEQIQEIDEAKSKALLGDAVIVGTVKNDIKDSVVEHIEGKMSLRAMTYGSDDTELDILVVVPASYVCRGIESGQTVNLPYYRVTIEKWM